MSDPRRRHLLLTSQLFAPGGIQYVGREALAALAGRGEDFDVWTLLDASVPPSFAAAGARIRCAGGSRSRVIRWAIRAAAGSCRDLSVIAMHAHLAPLSLPLRLRGASLAIMLYGVEVWRPLTAPEAAAFARADRLVAISQYTADRFRDANPRFHGAAIDICPLGVPPVATPAGLPAAGQEEAALIVARLSFEDRYKGHEALLRAWPAVRARLPRAQLVVVGDGDDRPRLESLAAALQIADAVHFAGRVSDAELARWYERCAFFVLPSPREGFGLVFIEAMRAGKACIGCEGAAREIIEPEATGLLVPDQAEGTLVEALVRLFSDGAMRERMGRAGRIRWRERFTSEEFARRFRALTGVASERAA